MKRQRQQAEAPAALVLKGTDTVEALLQMASACEQGGYFLQAIHCLMALLQASSLLPAMEARVRLNLGRMLLQHTCNWKEAHKELLRAQSLAQGLLSHVPLKCEVCCQLARYFETQGEAEHQVQMYDQALQMCRDAAATVQGPQLQRWAAQLHLLKAGAHASNGRAQDAHKSVHAGLATCLNTPQDQQQLVRDVQLQLLLFAMQLCLATGDNKGFQVAAEQAVQLVSLLSSCASLEPSSCGALSGQQGVQPAFVAAARLHLRLLQALHLLVIGRLDSLQAPGPPAAAPQGTDSLPPVVLELQGLATQAALQPAGYSWLPEAVVSALIHLVASLMYLHKNRFKQAIAQADAGSHALTAHLSTLGLDVTTACESGLDPVTLLECRTPLAVWLQLALLRGNALLGQGNLLAAQAQIQAAMSLAQRFPHQLHLMLFPLHVLAGQYCWATNEHAGAARHFQAVKHNCEPGPVHTLASVMLAVSLLSGPGEQGGTSGTVQAAIEALGQQAYSQCQVQPQADVQQGTDQAGAVQAVASQLACALIKLRLNQTQEARMLLGKCLQSAHAHLQHYALVCQVMLLMVPLQVDQADSAGARELANSSNRLSKGHPSLQVQVQRALQAMKAAESHIDAAAAAAAAAQREAEVTAAVQAALQGPGHIIVRDWGLMLHTA